MTPHSQAIAFRVWQHCRPIEWNCNINDAADAIGEPRKTVQAIVVMKNWHKRFRRDSPQVLPSIKRQIIPGDYASLIETLDEQISHIPHLD